MGCLHFEYNHSKVFMCGFNPVFRLPLADGRRVYMEWHRYCGPTLFHDRNMRREIDDWFDDKQICDAVEWFQNRGHKA